MKKKLLLVFLVSVFVLAMCSTTFAAGRALSYGMDGDDVYALQYQLYNYGYMYEDPTGYFGDITQEAVLNFQRDYGLDVDGIAGVVTTSYLGIDTADYGGYDDYEEESYSGYSSSGSLSRTLYNGTEGDDVYYLQQLLADYGYFYGDYTGYFGELTEAAVISFQSDYGLETDGVVGAATIGMLTGDYDAVSDSGSGYDADYMANYQSAVINAAYSTPASGAGYCAEWVTQVLRNAGVLTYNPCNLRSSYYAYATTSGLTGAISTGWNANDYWAYVCYSTDINDLQPGMVVATRNSYSYLGQQYGHVGIYIGDGLIMSSVGYIETLSFDEWNSRYNNTAAGSSIAWGYMPS